ENASGSSGSGTGTTTGSASTGGGPDWSAFCKALVDRQTKCDPTQAAALDQKCQASRQCWSAAIYAGAQAPLQTCLTGLACNSGDDGCYASTANVDPSFPQFRSDCLAKKKACEAAAITTFSNDTCGVGVASAALIAKLAACLTH